MTSSPADIQAAILVGGLGTRLREVVDDRPKPMAEVAGRPFLEWLVLYLGSLGIRRIILCTGHMADIVEGHFGDGAKFGVGIFHSREDAPLGTAGALRLALDLFHSNPILVLNGDSFCPFNPLTLLQSHHGGIMASLWLVETLDAGRFGTVELNKNGLVTAFREKDPNMGEGLINAGIYLLERSLISGFEKGKRLSLENDIFPRLPMGKIRGVVGKGPLLDIGTPGAFSDATRFIRRNLLPVLQGRFNGEQGAD